MADDAARARVDSTPEFKRKVIRWPARVGAKCASGTIVLDRTAIAFRRVSSVPQGAAKPAHTDWSHG